MDSAFTDRNGHRVLPGYRVAHVIAGRPTRFGVMKEILQDGDGYVLFDDNAKTEEVKWHTLYAEPQYLAATKPGPRDAIPTQVHRDIRAGDTFAGPSSRRPPMTQAQYLSKFNDIVTRMSVLTAAKNSDYASGDDAFQNFRMVESIGLTTLEIGILTRMTDKLQRVANLIKREAQVKTESVTDTLFDLAVYSVILAIYLESK